MSANEVLAIVVFVVVLIAAGATVYAAMKRRTQLLLCGLACMQIPLGIENLRSGPHWIAYFELVVGAVLIPFLLIARSRYQ